MYRESCERAKRQSAFVILSNLRFSTPAEHVANKVLRKSSYILALAAHRRVVTSLHLFHNSAISSLDLAAMIL